MTSPTPIEDGWRQIEAETPFCCDAHRDTYKAMYFSGAMAALSAMTGWEPEEPQIPLWISRTTLVAVSKELSAAYQDAMADHSAVLERVRH